MKKAILSCLLACMSLSVFNFAWTEDKEIPVCIDIPVGRLGYKLGTYLTIEGVRDTKGKVGVQTLLVDTINGKKIETPVSVWIDNIESLPAEKRCVIRGYESGKMIGVPDEVIKKENLSQPQASWQFYRYFIITSALEPKDLKTLNEIPSKQTVWPYN